MLHGCDRPPVLYYWRESACCMAVTDPQFYIIGGSCHKYHFCRDKRFATTNICRDKHNFVATKVCHKYATQVCHKYNFCRDKTRLLSRQKYACRDKTFATKKTIVFVATDICRDNFFCRDENILSRRKYFVATKIFCRDKTFVSANACLNSDYTHTAM